MPEELLQERVKRKTSAELFGLVMKWGLWLMLAIEIHLFLWMAKVARPFDGALSAMCFWGMLALEWALINGLSTIVGELWSKRTKNIVHRRNKRKALRRVNSVLRSKPRIE